MKKYILLLASLVLMLALASCSNNDNPKQKKTTKDDEMKVGEMMQEDKEHVWFVLHNPKTESLESQSDVDEFIITKNGKMKIYQAKTIPSQELGVLLKKDEKSLISEIKKQDEWYYKMKTSKLIGDTEADIENAKDLIKKGYDNYSPSKESHGGNDYAVIQKELHNKSPKESLTELKKNKKDLESLKYIEPKSQKVDLRSVGSNQLRISTNREFNLPKSFQTKNGEYNTFSNTIDPIEINGKKIAGLSSVDENSDSSEATEPYLITTVNNKVKKVLLDKPTDPAIKDNQEFKHKKGS
ncbi:hypothetical protein QWY52_14000 [Staphylococcus aureus]|uniref:hypothetical protein n=1 Tax=Staphylococcus TaxID=1279 RepID=UPI0015D83135|nr:hypothetical protein [Staphylococcus aureus]MDN5191678.1 hypothetical protein [Staphylococcus aureus]MDN5194339.1 hypothetical protein [Staphylococcus aureus]MDN5197012.1 hypothetical protein [Staphylococcus aureus]MDN5199682.1 hypothetical protein [Staphylococcus aureus]MDN5220186.1 hypothetical protein [Staphylococcus aureus]